MARSLGAVILAVTLIMLGAVSLYGRTFLARQLEESLRSDAFLTTQAFDGRIGQTVLAAKALAAVLERVALDADVQTDLLRRVVSSTPGVEGAGFILVDPANSQRVLAAPYVQRREGEIRVDSLAPVAHQTWLTQVMDQRAASWSPAMADAHDTRWLTFATPIERDGRVVGVAFADLMLVPLERSLRNVLTSTDSYGFALGPKRQCFAGTLQSELEAKLRARPLPPSLVDGTGLIEIAADPLRGEPAYLYRTPLKSYEVLLCIVIPADDVLAPIRKAQLVLVGVAVVFLAVTLVAVVVVARAVTRPVRALETAARAASGGDLTVQMAVPETQDELTDIPLSFNRLMADLRVYVQQLRDAAHERERVESELTVATRVQEAFLDQSRWPRPPNLEVHAQSAPARAVGGDFYDLFALDGDRIGIVLGDSSGHGMGAALFMAVCRTLIRALAPISESPSACLEAVNRHLRAENESMMFVTAVYAVLDVNSGVLTVCNAGHPPPRLLRADGALEEVRSPRCRPLGIRYDSRFPSHEKRLSPGDRLVLYSDGVTEAENAAQARFGSEALDTLLRTAAGASCNETVQTVASAVRTFVGSAEASDDQSVMVVVWRGPHLEIAPQVSHIATAQAWVAALIPEASRKTALSLQMALEEALANIIVHGGAASTSIVLAARPTTETITVTITDDGPPFDPTAPRPPAPARTPGGKGLTLMRASVDAMTYVREGGRNVLRLEKRLGEAGAATPAEEPAAPEE